MLLGLSPGTPVHFVISELGDVGAEDAQSHSSLVNSRWGLV